jgi:hypothetical protein
MKFGSSEYGYRQLKAERRLERQCRTRPEDLEVQLAKNAKRRERVALRMTPAQWQRIRSQDRPETFVNDKRVYYRTEYLKSEHWTALRARKLKASPVCEVCGSSCRVEPHHLRYKNLFDVELEDLKTLCRRHHVLEHQRLDRDN